MSKDIKVVEKNELKEKKGGSTMKEKILTFVIGFLVGAVVASSCFFVYTKLNPTTTTSTNSTEKAQFPGGGTPPDMNGEMPSGERPSKPGESTDESESSTSKSSKKTTTTTTADSE